MKQEIITTDLADFKARERGLLLDLLKAWDEQGLPEEFNDDEVRPTFNRNSGNVFLSNSEYQVAMMNGPTLEIWNYCSNCGHEGFTEDCQLNEDSCNECQGGESC